MWAQTQITFLNLVVSPNPKSVDSNTNRRSTASSLWGPWTLTEPAEPPFAPFAPISQFLSIAMESIVTLYLDTPCVFTSSFEEVVISVQL